MIKEIVFIVVFIVLYVAGVTWITSPDAKVYVEFKDHVEVVSYRDYLINVDFIHSTYKNEPYNVSSKPVYSTVGVLKIIGLLLVLFGIVRFGVSFFIGKKIKNIFAKIESKY